MKCDVEMIWMIYNINMTQYNKNEIGFKLVTLRKVIGTKKNNNNFDIQGLIEKYEIALLMLKNISNMENTIPYIESIEEEFKYIINRIS